MVKNFTKSINVRITDFCIATILLFVMIGGAIVIMHRPSWTMDDDTIIQCKTGMGKIMKLNERPVFVPEEGRFFPMAYQHNNIVLLFDNSNRVPAKKVYALNATVWCLFILMLFFICVVSINGTSNKKLKYWISALILLVITQRTFQMFTVLWATSFWSYFIIVFILFVSYLYLRYKTISYLVLLSLGVLYLSLCGEMYVSVPFVIGAISFLSIGDSEKDSKIGFIMTIIVILFFSAYMYFILPHIKYAYDGSHGSNLSVFQNIIHIFYSQKLLFVVLLTFIYRLYSVFVLNRYFDRYSDTFLCVAIGLLISNFILKLNWPIYYVSVILFALPSMLQLINLNNNNYSLLSLVCILFISGFYLIKFPKLINNILQERERNYVDFNRFDAYCMATDSIVWLQDSSSITKQKDNYAYSHLCMHLSQVKSINHYRPIDYRDITTGDFLLIAPESIRDVKLVEICGLDSSAFQWKDSVMSLKIYKIKNENSIRVSN